MKPRNILVKLIFICCKRETGNKKYHSVWGKYIPGKKTNCWRVKSFFDYSKNWHTLTIITYILLNFIILVSFFNIKFHSNLFFHYLLWYVVSGDVFGCNLLKKTMTQNALFLRNPEVGFWRWLFQWPRLFASFHTAILGSQLCPQDGFPHGTNAGVTSRRKSLPWFLADFPSCFFAQNWAVSMPIPNEITVVGLD